MKKDADKQVIAAIERAETVALKSSVSSDRERALRYYRGENVLPQEEGRSQYVSRDVYETVETIKPSVLETFLAGDEVVKFDPVGPEDVEQARLETLYINHIALRKNDAWNLFNGWLHDGLTQKVGYVEPYWDDAEDNSVESYKGLTIEEATLLTQDRSVEVVEAEQGEEGTFDIKVERTAPNRGVRYQNLPPESVLVDENATELSLQKCDFVQVRERKTISDLRALGYTVPEDISDGGLADLTGEEAARDEDGLVENDGEEPDPTMRKVWVRRTWIRTALYGGGARAKLWYVVLVGTTILEKEEAEFVRVIPFCPHPLPHAHYGLSAVDETEDLQDVKTAAIRGMLDNMYLANNGRYGVDEDNVNLDDMLVSRPGGVVRTKGPPSQLIMPLVHPNTQGVALSATEYFDQVREARTGLTRYTTGLDPNSLNQTARGVSMLMSASQARLKMIARNFAESVKELFWMTHALTLKYGRQPEMVELAGDWVVVDPRSWFKRKDLTITVGLGTGNKQEQMAYLMQALQFMIGPAREMGLTDPPRIFNALAKITNIAGFKSADEFWIDPRRQPQQQQERPPDPKAQAEMAKAQAQAQKAQADTQIKSQKMMADIQLKREQMAQNERLAVMEIEADIVTEREKAAAADRRALMTQAMGVRPNG